MEKTCNESRLGRFEYLLHGGKKPRMNRAFMIALVVVVFLSFVGVVSADDYWKGTPPKTELSGTVNGDVGVQFADTWTTPDNVVSDTASASFTLPYTPTLSPERNTKFARLYVVVYLGNMTANYYGNMTVTFTNSGVTSTLANHKALNLDYDRTSGATYGSVSGALKNLSRVTSDYVAVFDVTNSIATSPNIDVTVTTWNESVRLQSGLAKFDGRIKEVKLVYGWDVTSGSTGDTKYWVNEGQDPITKNMGTYTGNKTWFNSTGNPGAYTAKLWVNYLSNSTSGSTVGYGKYWWNNEADHILSPGCSGTGCYPPVITKGYYAGLLSWNWTQSSTNTPGNQNNDLLMYSNTSAWYKIPLAVFALGPEEE